MTKVSRHCFLLHQISQKRKRTTAKTEAGQEITEQRLLFRMDQHNLWPTGMMRPLRTDLVRQKKYKRNTLLSYLFNGTGEKHEENDL